MTVARAFWKGAINFGMVVIPVKMYVATKNERPRFHYLHKTDLTRPKQVYYCPKDEQYLTTQDMVRGYEYAKGQYVVFNESDFEKVPVRTTHTIDVMSFAGFDEVDPVYYYDSHYLEPEEIGEKPYCLFREVLREKNRVAISKVAFQRREHLCCIRPMDNILALHTLHYAKEVRSPREITVNDRELTEEELKMAGSLINEMTKKFEPEQYKDRYRIALEDMIEAKLQGREVVKVEEKPAEMPDLMAALRQSIESARKQPAEKEKSASGAKK
jgi:DNA end-binding protein Ku